MSRYQESFKSSSPSLILINLMRSFTFQYLSEELSALLQHGYEFIKCEEYVSKKGKCSLAKKTVVLRIDIDFAIKKTWKLLEIFNSLNIKGSFFIRLHAPEYNPFSFENYRIVRALLEQGHELGYHSEVVDQAMIWNEGAEECLYRDIDIINRMFNIKIRGVASHGGLTGCNNLDFWTDKTPQQYGLLYEGYDKLPSYNLFQDSLYVSDSEWTRWKSYNKAVRLDGDTRSPSEHAKDNHPLIHLLIHPDTYYMHNCYE
jgi:hypothetical protein